MSSTHCFLRTENRSIGHGVVRLRILNEPYILNASVTLISIARTRNFIMYTLGSFSRKRSHAHYYLLTVNQMLVKPDREKSDFVTVMHSKRSRFCMHVAH